MSENERTNLAKNRGNPMSKLQQFLYDKLIDCEALFEQANANSDIIYMKGMLEIGGMQTQLIANIGKRQAYQEVLEFIRKENGVIKNE